MKKEDYLLGKIVMVDPHAFSDSLQKPGQIGEVVHICKLDIDILTVEFDDGIRNAYRAEFLKTLSPMPIILDNIIYNRERLYETGDLGSLLLVYKLLTQGRIREALKQAMESNMIWFYSIIDCKNFRQLKQKSRQNSKKFKQSRRG